MTSCYLLIKVVSAGYNNYKVNIIYIVYLFSTLENKFSNLLIK